MFTRRSCGEWWGIEKDESGITFAVSGSFGLFGDNIGVHPGATANLESREQARLVYEWANIQYDNEFTW